LKKLINKIFIIPFLFIIFGIITFSIFYFFFVDDVTKKEFRKANEWILNNEKRLLKSSLDSIVDGAIEIRSAGYETTEKILKEFLKVYKKEYIEFKDENFFKKHSTQNIFIYELSSNGIYPIIHQTFEKVGGKKYLITIFNNKEFLSVEENLNNVKIGVAFKKDVIEKLIKNEIIEYISKINKKYPESHVAIGKIYNWHIKNGAFGEIFLDPVTKKRKILTLNDEYYKFVYNCLKIKDECFVVFKMTNPNTNHCEKMLAYIKMYRPYNWFFVKGFYYSQILGEIENIQEDIIKDVTELFIGTLILLFVFTTISFFIAYQISKRVMQKVIENYEKLKQKYEKSQNELINRYYTDTLTNLPNRNKLVEDIKEHNSLILLDIDDFSDLNDIYGFEFGDKVLNHVKDFLKKKFQNVYRIGSDTFAILLKREVTEKDLKELLNEQIKFNDIKINFTVGASNSNDKLLETAESALKVTLTDSSTKYKLYDDSFIHQRKENLEKLQIIYSILEKKAIIPYYHCIVDKNANVVKYEALMRIDNNGKILSPFFFLDLIKEAKLYPHFSAIMIEKVFNDLNEINKPVSINLSFEDIANKDLRDKIFSLLEKKDKDKVVIFEILESESIKDIELVVDFIEKVKKLGVKIAIDDFGTGYSNFVNVLQLHPDIVKIDQTLVKNINEEKFREIIRLITEFAHRFGIVTTAEFVSSKEIFEELLKLNIDEFQGFYFCEPKPLNEIKEKFENNHKN